MHTNCIFCQYNLTYKRRKNTPHDSNSDLYEHWKREWCCNNTAQASVKKTHFKMPENSRSFLYVRLWREKGDFSEFCQLLVCQPIVLLLLMDMLLPMMRKRLSGIAKRCFRVSGKASFMHQERLSGSAIKPLWQFRSLFGDTEDTPEGCAEVQKRRFGNISGVFRNC